MRYSQVEEYSHGSWVCVFIFSPLCVSVIGLIGRQLCYGNLGHPPPVAHSLTPLLALVCLFILCHIIVLMSWGFRFVCVEVYEFWIMLLQLELLIDCALFLDFSETLPSLLVCLTCPLQSVITLRKPATISFVINDIWPIVFSHCCIYFSAEDLTPRWLPPSRGLVLTWPQFQSHVPRWPPCQSLVPSWQPCMCP